MSKAEDLETAFAGLMLGTAVGDALGLPSEGLSPERIQRRWKGEWRMRLLPGRGMVSDDTEHAFFTGLSLLAAPDDVAAFRRDLARHMRWWIAGLPAGIGMATGRACIKLWLGVSPERSGVFSAGNGPAMRSAIIGAFFANDPKRRREYVSASTRLTHTDPKAETAALAIAEAAAWNLGEQHEWGDFLVRLKGCGAGEEWLQICQRLDAAIQTSQTVKEFADTLGLQRGVTGYAFHTVPVAIYAWFRHRDDYRKALVATLECGGDTDTVGAIVGALVGGRVGECGIPAEWVEGLWDWPLTAERMRGLVECLAYGKSQPVGYRWINVLPRNLFFLVVVLGHGFRRLLPPY